jgi:hypothetical protein
LVLDFGIQLAADQDAGGPDASRAETALAAVERAIAAKGQDQAAE